MLGAYFAAHLVTLNPPTASGLLVLFLMTGLGLRRLPRRLHQDHQAAQPRPALEAEAHRARPLVGVIFAVLALQFPNEQFRTPASLLISFVRDTNINLAFGAAPSSGCILFVIWANVMIAGTSNGVNLTDGLDGLADRRLDDGASAPTSSSASGRTTRTARPTRASSATRCATRTTSRSSPPPGMGACFGFLWWNATPAKIFMGDTGSLALGGALAGLAITHPHRAARSSSSAACSSSRRCRSIAQVASFKTTGKRVLRMAPLHHHFEMVGWNEVTVVVRFWIIAGLFVALGLGVFYAEWVVGSPVSFDPLLRAPRGADPPRRRLVGPAASSSSGSACRGFAAADALADRGRASSRSSTRDVTERDHASAPTILDILDVDVRLGPEHVVEPAGRGRELVVTSPGVPPHDPLMLAAAAAPASRCGARSSSPGGCARRDGRRAVAHRHRHQRQDDDRQHARLDPARRPDCGPRAPATSARPLLEAVLHPEPYDVLAVELSSFQLHWQRSVVRRSPRPCLNVAPDHLDWHGSLRRVPPGQGQDLREHPPRLRLQRRRPADRAARHGGRRRRGLPGDRLHAWASRRRRWSASSRTCSPTAPSSSSGSTRPPSSARWPTCRATRRRVAPHYVANALAAAALARAYGVGPVAVRDGLRAFRPDPHRIAEVATVDGVRFVNDSKATNPHAAAAAIRSFDSVVWVAGGLLKGADVDSLVERDRPTGCAAWSSSAPTATGSPRPWPDTRPMSPSSTCPTRTLESWTGCRRWTTWPRASPQPGDVVLLAPAAASMDMFTNYGARGDAFEEAVRRCGRGRTEGAGTVSATDQPRTNGPSVHHGGAGPGLLHRRCPSSASSSRR